MSKDTVLKNGVGEGQLKRENFDSALVEIIYIKLIERIGNVGDSDGVKSFVDKEDTSAISPHHGAIEAFLDGEGGREGLPLKGFQIEQVPVIVER